MHSIESRAPFLDHRLVEFMLKVHDSFKIREGRSKAILRKALSGILPDLIRDRVSKMGFAAPDEIWFKQNAEMISEALIVAIKDSQGIFTDDLLSNYRMFANGKLAYDNRYLKALTLSSLIRQYKLKVD
jgi:asparagine synthase (glutamine-hydrolysing)